MSYNISLLDASDDSVLAVNILGNPPGNNACAQNTLELTILDGNPRIGNNLKICLLTFGGQALFDLVTLDATSTDPSDRPIGGTVGSMDTATLLVAGAQANMGLWSLALVGIVGAGAAIIYKTKSKKTKQ